MDKPKLFHPHFVDTVKPEVGNALMQLAFASEFEKAVAQRKKKEKKAFFSMRMKGVKK